MARIFIAIVQGEIPGHEVGEDVLYVSLLDINPLREGHALVIPKVEVDQLFDLDDDLLSGILPFAKEVARRIKKVVPCARIGLTVIGLEVPHAHIHLIPINGMHDMEFSRPKLTMSHEALAALAQRIAEA